MGCRHTGFFIYLWTWTWPLFWPGKEQHPWVQFTYRLSSSNQNLKSQNFFFFLEKKAFQKSPGGIVFASAVSTHSEPVASIVRGGWAWNLLVFWDRLFPLWQPFCDWHQFYDVGHYPVSKFQIPPLFRTRKWLAQISWPIGCQRHKVSIFCENVANT